jgi:phosphate transport system substrate-binding protein
MKYVYMLLAVGFIVGALGPACAADITGAGATFPHPIYAKWADAYKKQNGRMRTKKRRVSV